MKKVEKNQPNDNETGTPASEKLEGSPEKPLLEHKAEKPKPRMLTKMQSMPVDLAGNLPKQLDDDIFGLEEDQWDLNEDIKEEADEGDSSDNDAGPAEIHS